MQKFSEWLDYGQSLRLRRSLRWPAIILATILMTMNFAANTFHQADDFFFSAFQVDSEALVVSSLVADRLSIKKGKAHLGFLGFNGKVEYPMSLLRSFQIYRDGPGSENITFAPYRSSLGGQGWFFSLFSHTFQVRQIVTLHRLTAALLSLVLLALFFLYRRVYDRSYAWLFLLGMLGSPWVVSFARNLYWVSFLWFLPSVFSGLLLLARKPWQRVLSAIGIVFAVFLKSATGYEYLSSITLLAVSPYLLAPLLKGRMPSPKDWLWTVTVFLLCLTGFSIALGWHASLRGDGLVDGLLNIYEQDVRRRSWGNAGQFDPVLRASLQSSVGDVLTMYFMEWQTPLLFKTGTNAFRYLVALALGVLIFRAFKGRSDRWTQLFAFVVFLSIPLSWFVLMKGHSFVHTHMNFVLWYFGFVQFCFYLIWKQILEILNYIKALQRGAA